MLLDRHGVAVLRWLGRYDHTIVGVDEIEPSLLETISPERVAAIADGSPLPAHAAASSDVWSLGLLGHTLLTGRSAFAPSRGELLRDIVTRSIPPPHEVAEGVSEQAGEACLAALHRDPSRRPATMAAFAIMLRAAADAGEDEGKKRFGLFGRKG